MKKQNQEISESILLANLVLNVHIHNLKCKNTQKI